MDAVPSRLAKLRTGDWWARKKIIEEIVDIPETHYLGTLEAWLRNGQDALARNAAMEVYRALGTRATTPLRRLLADADADVRIFAANLLGDIGDETAFQDLHTAMKDANVNLRMAAVEAMGKIGDERAVGPIVDVMDDAPWTVMAALEALGRIGGDRAREALHGFLARGEYRGMTCEALERAGDRTTLYHLRPYLGKGEIGGRVLKAIVIISKREGTTPPGVLPEDIESTLVVHAGSADEGVRHAAVVALGWCGGPAAAPCLIVALEEDALQEDAVGALAAMGRHAAPAILDALRRPGGQRGILAKLLAMAGVREAYGDLADDPDPEVRTEAALALGNGRIQGADETLRRLAQDPVEEVRAAACLALRERRQQGKQAS